MKVIGLDLSLFAFVQVYNVSSGKSIPEWISEAKRKSLQKSEEYRYACVLTSRLAEPEANL